MPTKKTTKPSQSFQKGAETLKTIAGAITAVITIGTASAGVCAWLTAQLNASTNEKLEAISADLADIRQDTVRLQLLELIDGDPENIESILTVARTYFDDLHGDWYMTARFKRWATEHDIDIDDFQFQH